MFEEYYNRKKQEPTYVILGCQGSGTNLASRLLQQTLSFSVVHDRSLIFNSAVEVSKNPTSTTIEAQFKRIRRRIFPGKLRRRFMLKRHYRQAKHFSGLPTAIATDLVTTASEFASYLYAYHAFNSGAKHQGLKSDDLWETIEHIDAIIPNRRYILLVRDPRDNAISITNKDFGPKDIFAASEYVRFRMAQYANEVNRQKPENVVTITYENLLNQPVRELEKISSKWQLDLADDYVERIEKMNIRSHNSRKWAKLPHRRLQICESILGEMIDQYGYERGTNESTGVSSFQKLCWSAKDVAQRVPQRAYKTCRNLVRP